MSNTTVQSVSTNNNTTNKENTMITVNQVKALLDTYKQAQQKAAKLQATLDNYKTLQTQAEKNNTAILKRVLEINDAIREIEANNNSLQKAVEDKGNVQAVINTQEECFAILDGIEEMMTSPEKVTEGNAIAECKEALHKVEETNSTLVIPTECNTVALIPAGAKVTALLSELKKPVERPIIKKGNPQPQQQSQSPVETVTVVENAEPQKCEEQTKTTTTVETITVENGAMETEELTEQEKTEKFLKELAVAKETQGEKVKVSATVTTSEFPTTTHELPNGTVIEWKQAALSEVVLAVDEEGNNLTEDIIDFIEEFLGDEDFDASEPYTFETHNQFRKAAPNAPQIKEVPFLAKVVEYVHYVIKSFYCTNLEAVNPVNEHEMIRVVSVLKDGAFYEGCALDAANCF